MRASDKRGFEAFVLGHSERAFQFAYSLCGRAEDASDLVQAAFCRLLSEWDSYDPTRPLNAWFFTILRNIFLDSQKLHHRRAAVSLDAPGPGSGDASYQELLPNAEEPILDRLEREETIAFVRRTLKRLNSHHRAVLTLCDLRRLRYDEAAGALKVPIGTVRSRMSRARKAFRRKFASVACDENASLR